MGGKGRVCIYISKGEETLNMSLDWQKQDMDKGWGKGWGKGKGKGKGNGKQGQGMEKEKDMKSKISGYIHLSGLHFRCVAQLIQSIGALSFSVLGLLDAVYVVSLFPYMWLS